MYFHTFPKIPKKSLNPQKIPKKGQKFQSTDKIPKSESTDAQASCMHCECWIPVHCDATREWERSGKVRKPGYL